MHLDTMKIIIKGQALIKGAPPHVVDKLIKDLTYLNPEYDDALKAGRWISQELARKKHLKYYRMNGDSIIIPRAMVGKVLNWTKFPQQQITDFTVAPTIDIEFTGKLRDYQEAAVADIMRKRYGVLEAATGAGKTLIGIKYVCERKLKTLIIVHNKELFMQWQERFKQFSTIKEFGLIGGGKFSIGDVTIGIINSVEKRLEEIKDEFGIVIYDECHRVLGDTWTKAVNTLRPRFHIGMSATPYRRQRHMTKALFCLLGPMMHKVDRTHLINTGAVLQPRIIRRNTSFDRADRNIAYTQLVQFLCADKERNIQIGNDIIEEFKRYKEPIMVVSDRITHCEAIKYMIDGERGITPLVLNGNLPKKYREQTVKDMKEGFYNVLIATVSLLGEGFDAPDLNSIFLTTPIKFQGRTLQTIGRILRPSGGGQPRVYDYRDVKVKTLLYSGFARDRIYKEYGWEV
jgi:superfamily II DNA or RNA helicase